MRSIRIKVDNKHKFTNVRNRNFLNFNKNQNIKKYFIGVAAYKWAQKRHKKLFAYLTKTLSLKIC
jgi:hypothetical protein